MNRNVKGLILAVVPIALSLMGTLVFAESSGGDLSSMAATVTTEASAIAKLLNVAAYVAGVGFALAGILQFKAHKENPQQTPLSKPVVMIVVAACLLFLPTIMNVAGQSLFGTGGISAQSAAGISTGP